MGFGQLMDKAKEYLPSEKMPMVEDAYNFAMKAHEGQVRKSGEPYLEHPLQVALTLAELNLIPALWLLPCYMTFPRIAV